MYELQHSNQEEARVVVAATRYFVHTESSRDELIKEGIAPENIFVTDSTEVDAVMLVAERIRGDGELKAKLATDLSFLDPGKRLILISGQRHENHEACFDNLFRALKRLASRSDVQVVYPVHPDSKVKGIADETFVYHPNITLIQPQDYLHYVYLIQTAFLILTDSGDTLKEVSSLNKPVLEMIDVSRCSRAANTVSVRSAEMEAENILRECTQLLDDPFCYRAYASRRNPYGDGHASQRIVETLLQ
jgi:UDP-N-acetylglucosamine 2-epimerase (non-hydrolysing)